MWMDKTCEPIYQRGMPIIRMEENIPYESHRVCSEQEAATNLDREVDICMRTPAVQCCQTTVHMMYN